MLAVAGLGDEAGDDPVEDDVVVETLAGEVDEVLARLRRIGREQVDVDVALLGAIVSLVIGIGWAGISTPAAAAVIASATSIPVVTDPMIWYVLALASDDWAASESTMKNCDPTEFGAAVRAIATVPRA